MHRNQIGKAMLYRKFLTDYKEWCSLSTNEQIVYSLLLNYAITRQDCVFDADGNLDMEFVHDAIDISDDETLELPRVSYSKIANKCGISERSLKGRDGIIASLMSKGLLEMPYIDYWKIVAPKDLIDGGYMVLPSETGLKELQLVFWAFICERLKHYNQNQARKSNDSRWLGNKRIDTWASKLAQDFGVKTKDVQNLIHKLAKKNFVKRSEDGKYLWLNIELKNIVINERKKDYYGSNDLEF